MRYIYLVILLTIFLACKKYKDPAPFTDPRIKNKYCNDPSAVNYNWDFPGIPDNSVCIYPTQLFEGNYKLYDTLIDEIGLYISNDSFDIQVIPLDTVKFKISGLCTSKEIFARATRFFQFSIDTVVGNGQVFCLNTDTVSGRGNKKGIGDTLSFKMNYEVISDTGITLHKSVAIKK